MPKPLLLSLALTFSCQAAEWEQLPPLPEPNGGFVCGHEAGQIIVIGGTNWEGGKKNWLRAIHSFDPTAGQWTKISDPRSPVAYATVFQEGTDFAYLGGTDGQQSLKALVVIAGEKTSRKINFAVYAMQSLPVSLVLAVGGHVAGRYVIAGGTDDATNVAGVQRSVHAVETINGRLAVVPMADYPGKPFAVAASSVVGNELFVFGGMNCDETIKTPLNSAEVYAFLPERNVWRKLKPLETPIRGMSAVTLDDRHIYLAGGYTDDFTQDAVIYDVTSDSYRKAKPLPYAAMVSLVVCDGFVYCLGGEDKMKSRTDQCFRIPVAELLK